MKGVFWADSSVLDDIFLFEKLYRTVNKERKSKIDSLKKPEDKNNSLAAFILLKAALRECGYDESIVMTLTADNNGKPFFEGYSDIFFNLSHSGNRVMCVINDTECGCDVQQRRSCKFRIAEKYFSEAEKKLIFGEPDDDIKSKKFYSVWAYRESFVKAIGRGLTLSMHDYSTESFGDYVRIRQSCDSENYCAMAYDVEDEYVYAVCTKENDFMNLKIKEIKINELIRG